MANMTRDQMKTELQSRGWNRFGTTELDKYLDWALQDIYRKGNFPYVSSRLYVGASGLASGAGLLTIATVTGGTSILAQVEGVWLEDPNVRSWQLETATRDQWEDLIMPNIALDGSTKEVLGPPRMYYVHDASIYFYPAADKAYDIRINWTDEQIAFSSGSATSGLPERFDPAIIAAAEVHCNRRARDYESMAIANALVAEIVLDEMGKQRTRFYEEAPRIEPFRSPTSTY